MPERLDDAAETASSDGRATALDQAELERELLGGETQYTLDEICERVGMERAQASRLWMALGFPVDRDPSAAMFTDTDVEAFETFSRLVRDGLADDHSQLAIARSLGHAMARVAEWEIDVLAAHLGAVARDGDAQALRQAQRRAAESTIPELQQLQVYAWRRHLAAAAGRAQHADEAESTRTLAIGFADMVGYTRLTRHLDTSELSELVDRFESGTTERVTEHGGWVIKNVGDEVMFASESPADIAAIALALADFSREESSRDFTIPELRIGLAFGPVLQRFGDAYGPVVNVAARLTGVARPGTILVDAKLAAELDGSPRLRLISLRPVRVKGISRLRAHVLRRDTKSKSD